MDPSLSSVLLLFLAAPLVYGASTSTSTSAASASSTTSSKASSTASSTDDGEDHVTVTSVVTGPSGPTTRTETFVPTTYSQFKEASSTVTTKTIITVQYGSTSSSVSTYNYEIGPGGVGWRLPSFSNGALFPLPFPTYLPGETPSSGSSSKISSTASSTAHTSSASVTSSRTGSSSSRSSTKASSTDSTSSTTRHTDSTSNGPPGDEDNPDDPTKTDKTTEKTSTTKKTSTTDECSSTSTVSNCEVRCAKTTTSNSCASYSSTCSETKTGCSVTGTVTTITSSTSSCSTCGSCMTRGPAGNGGPPAPTDPPIRPDDEEEGASDLRKRDHPRHLQKRAGTASEVKTLGACALATGTVSKLTRPAWPKASGDILNPDSQGKMKAKWSVMSRYDRATGTGPCGTVPTVTRVDAKGFKVASNYQALDGKTKPDNDRLSLDHAYEKSWIKDFLESIAGTSTGGGKLACSDINTFFFPQAKAPQTCQWSLLQPVWNSIASDKNPQYFIAMSQYVNGDGKGSFFQDPVKPLTQSYITDPLYKVANDGKWHWDTGKKAGTTSALDALRDMINKGFERTLIGCVEMKMAPMLDLMDKTNNRIYDELSLIDQRIGLPANQPLFGASNVPKWTTAFGSSGIAGAYKDYMTKNIEPQITLPPPSILPNSGISSRTDLQRLRTYLT
ncbi:hypothetical protein PG987_008220 [Apiospora arundinis]